MACYHPYIRIEWPLECGYAINKKGEIKNKSKIITEAEYKLQYNKIPKEYITQIPCGVCIGCRLDYSREWANRITLEAKKYKPNESWFLTLTYNDESIPFKQIKNKKTEEIKQGVTLNKKDVQDFFKRLRRHYEYHYKHKGIRFYIAGEYGETTNRPHYHACIFNMPIFTENKKYKINELGQTLWTNEEIEKIWGKGFIAIGRISWDTAAYTARYMLKKQKGPDAKWYYESQAKEPEFTLMSRKPGIARDYYEENKEKIYKNDEIIIPKGDKSLKIKPPKYYDKLYDIEYHEEMEEIKLNRKINAEKAKETKLKRTTKTEQEIRIIQERQKIESIKKCKREL